MYKHPGLPTWDCTTHVGNHPWRKLILSPYVATDYFRLSTLGWTLSNSTHLHWRGNWWHYTSLIQEITLLRVHGCISRRHYLSSCSHPGPLKIFPPSLWWCSLSLRCRSCIVGVSLGVGYHTNTYSLYFDHLNLYNSLHLWKNKAFVMRSDRCISVHKIFGIPLDIAFAWENYSSEFSSRAYDSSSHGLFFLGLQDQLWIMNSLPSSRL